jgi:glycogen operon protein
MGSGLRDVFWFRPDGREMGRRDWASGDLRALGMFLNGEEIPERSPRGERMYDDSFLLLVNAGYEAASFRLPARRFGNRWLLVVSTAEPDRSEGSEAFTARADVPVAARSLVLLRRSW